MPGLRKEGTAAGQALVILIAGTDAGPITFDPKFSPSPRRGASAPWPALCRGRCPTRSPAWWRQPGTREVEARVQARKDWKERALTHAGRVPSERVQRLESPAEPAPGAGRRRSPQAAFPSPGPRPRPATSTRRVRRPATACDVGRKAATHLDHAHHAQHSPPRIFPINCRTFPSRSLRRFWQYGLEHLAMWLPGYTYQSVSLATGYPHPDITMRCSIKRKLRNEPSTKMRADRN